MPYCITHLGHLSWFLPSVPYPTNKMSSAMPYTFGRSLSISSFFYWNISSVGLTPNGSLVNLYLRNWHVKVVRYEDILSTFRLWYPECVSYGRHLYVWGLYNLVLALCIFALWVPRWVLHPQSVVLIFVALVVTLTLLNGPLRLYAMHLWGTWYGFPLPLTCK